MRLNAAMLHDKEDVSQSVWEMSGKLTEFEKEVYDLIKERGEMLTSNVPTRMSGAIPSLDRKGVIEVFKKSTSRWASKKRKFVRIRGLNDGS